MPNFSTPPPCTSTPCTPLIKWSRDNIYPHCACTNKIPLHSSNTTHNTHTIIMHAHTMHASIMRAHTTHISIMHVPLNMHRAMLNLVRTHAQEYFSHITTLHRATPKLSAHTHTPIFSALYHSTPQSAKFKCAHPCTNIFRSLPLCTAQHQIEVRTTVCQYFMCLNTMHHTAPNFSMRSHTPLISTHHNLFTAHHAFLVCTPTHIHFYAHQFLVNSATETEAFAKIFLNFHHRHSATMKFVQIHLNKTNSTSATKNRCWLTFLE
jgi:hypothetical protein